MRFDFALKKFKVLGASKFLSIKFQLEPYELIWKSVLFRFEWID